MRRSKTGRLTRVVCSIVLAAVMVPMWAAPAMAKGGDPVYRFYNHANGSHFYTASEDERAMVSAKFSSIYAFEGVAYWTVPSDFFVFNLEAQAVNGELPPVPLHRFYNKANGSHFYTISEVEKAYVQANYGAIYTYEGTAYNVFASPNTYFFVRPVFRFYNLSNGSHFYTISDAERAYVQVHYPGTYRYEGVAFYTMPFGYFYE